MVLVIALAAATATVAYLRRPVTAPLIAHALGAVGGRVYTNSREAFAENYRRGFRVFEVDLMLTRDSVVVASHVFGNGVVPFGIEGRVESLTREEFLRRRYFTRYTPLDLPALFVLAGTDTTVRLILDAKANMEGVSDTVHDSRTFRAIHERVAAEARAAGVLAQLWPQIYEERDAAVVAALYGLRHPVVYTLYRTRATDAEVAAFVRSHPHVVAVAAWFAEGHERLSAELVNAVAPTPVWAYTINDRSRARRATRLGATALYTDHLTPQ
jgi:glycerophosphoryl diester phosphodiesterase